MKLNQNSIAGLYESEKGPLSGWKIAVNGCAIDPSSGTFPVNPDDSIRWYYTTNYWEY